MKQSKELTNRQINDDTVSLIGEVIYTEDNVAVMAFWDDRVDKTKGWLTDHQLLELNKYLKAQVLC